MEAEDQSSCGWEELEVEGKVNKPRRRYASLASHQLAPAKLRGSSANDELGRFLEKTLAAVHD
jgi:hypothetical protein